VVSNVLEEIHCITTQKTAVQKRMQRDLTHYINKASMRVHTSFTNILNLSHIFLLIPELNNRIITLIRNIHVFESLSVTI
jgi:hypothetical protein